MRDTEEPGGIGPTRMSGFSDGFFAIVITLLVIELRPPPLPEDAPGYRLTLELAALWPNIAAFTISFINILIIWVTHHELMRITEKVDTRFLYLNGMLLFGVAVAPFSTAILAEHILGPAAKPAAAIYCGVFAWIALMFNLLWSYVAGSEGRLIETVSRRDRRRIARTYAVTLALYLGCVAMAFIAPRIAVGLTLAMAAFFAVADRLSGFASEDIAMPE